MKIARTLVQAILASRVAYGAMCFTLTKKQTAQLEVLCRAALRVITGLPRHTSVDELYRYAGMPALEMLI